MIRLSQTSFKVVVRNSSQSSVKITSGLQGPRGPAGPPADPAITDDLAARIAVFESILAGGLSGQSLVKASNAPFDFIWADVDGSPAQEQPDADFIVKNDADWDAVFANSDAQLANKIVEISGSNFSTRSISNRDFTAAGGALTIRSADTNAYFPRQLRLANNSGLKIEANFQMTGWPMHDSSCIYFGTGSHDEYDFTGASFRHGYGPTQANFVTDFDYPEYTRVDNTANATTTSTTHPLNWENASFEGGKIWVFNNGTDTIYFDAGDATVTAATGINAVAAGSYGRFDFDANVTTHFAIISASGTQPVNARAEIGMVAYLAPAFTSSGAANIGRIHFRDCRFSDLNNAMKGLANVSELLVMDCTFDRIYQDIISVAAGQAYFLRNLDCVPFSRSGIAQDAFGDPNDPHGDNLQNFGTGAAPIGPIYLAGNRTRINPVREGVIHQGIFLSDNDIVPSYRDVFIISSTQLNGNSNSINVGESTVGFCRDVLVHGVTAVKFDDPTSTHPALKLITDDPSSVSASSVLAGSYSTGGAGVDHPLENCVFMNTASSPSSLLPNFGDLATARTRAEIEAALTTAGEAQGIGAVATRDAIDWDTQNHLSVIRWDKVPSGADWLPAEKIDFGALHTFPLAKVKNPRAAQTVAPFAGVEWRSVDTDKTTEVQAWTSATGTIEPNQFLQIRATASSEAVTTTDAAIAINGFTSTASITTKVAAPTQYLTTGSGSYFEDTANVPAGTTRLTYHGWFYFPVSVPSGILFAQVSQGCDLDVLANGRIRILKVEDGTGATMISSAYPSFPILPDTFYEITFDVDQTEKTARVTVNGVTETIPFTATGNGLFQSTRAVTMLALTGGSNGLPAGVRVADLSVSFNGTLRKALSNDPAVVNADAWQRGGDFV